MSGFDVAWKRASSAVEFRHYLHTPFDLILSAKSADGLEALEALRVMGQEGRRLPFIVVDPLLEPSFAAACLDEGALTCVAPENLVEAIRLNHDRIRPAVTGDPPLSKGTEDVLRESEEKFRSLAEESPSMIFINQGGRVVYANPQAALVMGYTREELCDPAFDFMTLIAPDSRELALGNLDRHRRGEDISPYTYALVARDGRRIEAIHTTRLIQYDGAPAVLGIVTDITEQRRFEASLARRAAQLATLSEIGARIAAMADVKEVLERAAHLVHERFGYEHVGIFLKVAGAGVLRMEARAGSFDEVLSSGHTVALGDGMVGSAASSGEVLLANDVEQEPRYINYFPDRVRTRSELSVPIRTGGATVGVLDVQSTQGEAFGDNDVLVLGILGDQLGAVIADARLYEALRASEERYRALSENAAIGIYRTTPDGQILFVNPAGIRMLGFDSLEELAARNLESEGFSPAYPRTQFKERLEREGEIIGMESAWSRRDGSTIYVRENARLIRDEAGRAVYYEGTVEDVSQRKAAEQELERHAQELQALYETSLETIGHKDLPALLKMIVERATGLVGTDKGGLYLLNAEGTELTLVISHNYSRDFTGAVLRLGEGVSGRVAQTGEVVTLEDYQTFEPKADPFRDIETRRLMAVPLKAGGRIVGVLNVADNEPGAFEEHEVRLVHLFADQAALALENARLREAERARLTELARANQLMTGLSRVAARLERTHDPEQVLTTLRDYLLPLGVNFWMAIIDPPTGDLVVRYATPAAGALALLEKTLGFTVRGYHIPRDRVPFYDEVLVERKPLFLSDSAWMIREMVPMIPGAVVDQVLKIAGAGRGSKVLCLPLESEGGILGGLFLWGNDLNEGAMESYAVFASQVAVAFEQARLLEAERQRSAALSHSHGLLAALSQVAVSIERTEDPDEFLASLGDELQRIGLGCWIAMVDHEAETFVLRYVSVPDEVQEQAERVVGARLRGLVIPGKRLSIYRDLVRERKPVLVLTAELVRQLMPRLPKRAVKILLELGGSSSKTRTIGLPLVIGFDSQLPVIPLNFPVP